MCATTSGSGTACAIPMEKDPQGEDNDNPGQVALQVEWNYLWRGILKQDFTGSSRSSVIGIHLSQALF